MSPQGIEKRNWECKRQSISADLTDIILMCIIISFTIIKVFPVHWKKKKNLFPECLPGKNKQSHTSTGSAIDLNFPRSLLLQ